MKPYNARYILIPCLLFVQLSSCEDFLDQDPISTVPGENFWSNNREAELGMAGGYDAVQGAFRITYLLWGEARADNFSKNDRSRISELEILQNAITASNIRTSWENLYRVINIANQAIANIPNINEFDVNLLAEAYAMRAFAYFTGVRLWGDMPLFTEPVSGLDDNISRPRTPASDIINEVIIPDLEMAESLFTKVTDQRRFSTGGVLAIQADVYMWTRDFDSAIEAIDKLIDLERYSLARDSAQWIGMFLNDPVLGEIEEGPELIFSIGYEGDFDGENAGGFRSIFNDGTPTISVGVSVVDKWLAKFPNDSVGWVELYGQLPPGDDNYGDWRLELSAFYDETPETDQRLVRKYLLSAQQGATIIGNTAIEDITNDTDYPVYRYADMLLLKAEALNQLGIDNKFEAIDILNDIRAARQLPLEDADNFFTKESIEDLLLDERQFELFAEGHRWYDLVRTGKAMDIAPGVDSPGELLWPIFFEHFITNSNPDFTQNPGY